jgi:hypothetical protein
MPYYYDDRNGLRYSFGVFLTLIEDEFDLTRALTSGILSTYMLISSVATIFPGGVQQKTLDKWHKYWY